MRSLLDINVLIALLDADHSMHEQATGWLAEQRDGWASCPLTQNGCLRIMSHPGYPNGLPLQQVAARLTAACSSGFHEFWADDVSVLDAGTVDIERVHGPRQITDVYLLALSVNHGGRFVTFDNRISRRAVRDASPAHLLQL